MKPRCREKKTGKEKLYFSAFQILSSEAHYHRGKTTQLYYAFFIQFSRLELKCYEMLIHDCNFPLLPEHNTEIWVSKMLEVKGVGNFLWFSTLFPVAPPPCS